MLPTHLQPRPSRYPNALAALLHHYPLYLYEAAELGAFMLSACAFTVLLFGPHAHLNPWLARALMGLAMALTAIAIIKSPWGRRSGAHFNPAISLTFYRLGKIGPYDTIFYILSHFAGASAGVALAALLFPRSIALPQVDYAVTIPGLGGPPAAFAAEFFMAALLMATVLATSSRPRLARYTPWLVGLLIANYILFLAPVSGFSVNPARTFGSAVCANLWTGFWIYCTAPILGMFAAAEVFVRLTTKPHPYFHHRHLTHDDPR